MEQSMERSIELSIDHLTNLPVDLLLQQLSYLPFEDVIAVCKSNSKLHYYCSDPKYNNNWKSMIDNIYGNVHNYQNKLKKIWSKLNISEGTYNYLVYTQLIDILDSLTQLMIYYRQGDTKSFNKFNDYQRFLSMFLLNKPDEMQKYKPYFDTEPYYLLLQGKIPSLYTLDSMFRLMAAYNNIYGVKYMLEKGANIHAHNEGALATASEKGHLDVIKYLGEQGVDIHFHNDDALRRASERGHLDVVKYLVEQGAAIHAFNDYALKLASKYGHLDVVKYLQEHI